MASVQELLLAAQAQKSPFISLLEGVASGYRDSQMKALDDQKKMQDLAQQKQQMQFTKMVQDAYEKTLKNELTNASAPVDGSFPQQKLDSVINLGSRGANIKISTPQQYGPSKTSPGGRTIYTDSNGRRRIGFYDNNIRDVVRKETDAFAPMPATKPASGGGMTSSQSAALHAKAVAMANSMFLAEHQDRYNVDTFGKRQGFDLNETDRTSDEYNRYLNIAIEQLTKGPSKSKASGSPSNSFNSVAEAEAANLPAGTIVTIGGRKARIK
jgi:hypothetical protein